MQQAYARTFIKGKQGRNRQKQIKPGAKGNTVVFVILFVTYLVPPGAKGVPRKGDALPSG